MLRDTRKVADKIRKELLGIATALCESPVSDYEMYREQVGRYQGLKFALSELLKDLDDGSDDDRP